MFFLNVQKKKSRKKCVQPMVELFSNAATCKRVDSRHPAILMLFSGCQWMRLSHASELLQADALRWMHPSDSRLIASIELDRRSAPTPITKPKRRLWPRAAVL